MTSSDGAAGNLIVVVPGIGTTIQDAGRPGWQRFGVPVSGALDRIAHAAANIVVGNPPDTAAIECLYVGCTLRVDAIAVRCAAAGAGASLDIELPGTEQKRRVPSLESFTAPHGSRITLRLAGPSISAYLAIEGGITTPPVLGSRSTYVRAGLGGIDGRRFAEGDAIPCASAASTDRREMCVSHLDLAPPRSVRVVLGPQDDRFTAGAIATLSSATYAVAAASDRMGLRLEGPRLEHTDGADILSDGIAPGAIQVPGSGLPIIMLADRQTTGGYTKIATVISSDVAALGRIGPGTKIRFEIVDVETAEAAARQLAATLSGWQRQLQPVAPDPADIDRALRERNLVSGVVDAVSPLDPTARGR